MKGSAEGTAPPPRIVATAAPVIVPKKFPKKIVDKAFV
jgi:hypothetical protein